MSETLQQLVRQLDLEQLEVNLFRGQSADLGGRSVFGGQVIGQALVAAGRTVQGREPHSLHAYFLLPGDMTRPIVYQVDAIRDGKSFTTRRVQAIQPRNSRRHIRNDIPLLSVDTPSNIFLTLDFAARI